MSCSLVFHLVVLCTLILEFNLYTRNGPRRRLTLGRYVKSIQNTDNHANNTTDVRSNSPAAPTPDTEDTPNTETGAHALKQSVNAAHSP